MFLVELLRRIYDVVRLDIKCTEVHDVINHHYTITFKFSGMYVDFSWDCVDTHTPTIMKRWLMDRLRGLPPIARDFFKILVDIVKDTNACYSRIKGFVKNRLKGIHWLLLGMAWWSAEDQKLRRSSESLERCGLEELVSRCLLFYARFEFENFTVDFSADIPFRERAFTRYPVSILDPTVTSTRNKNLGTRVDASSLQELRADLHQLHHILTMDSVAFWRYHSAKYIQLAPALPGTRHACSAQPQSPTQVASRPQQQAAVTGVQWLAEASALLAAGEVFV